MARCRCTCLRGPVASLVPCAAGRRSTRISTACRQPCGALHRYSQRADGAHVCCPEGKRLERPDRSQVRRRAESHPVCDGAEVIHRWQGQRRDRACWIAAGRCSWGNAGRSLQAANAAIGISSTISSSLRVRGDARCESSALFCAVGFALGAPAACACWSPLQSGTASRPSRNCAFASAASSDVAPEASGASLDIVRPAGWRSCCSGACNDAPQLTLRVPVGWLER